MARVLSIYQFLAFSHHNTNSPAQQSQKISPTALTFPLWLANRHPSSRVVFSCSDDRTIAMHQLDATSSKWTLAASVVAHDEAITCIAASADGRYLATGSSDFSIRIWYGDHVNGRCLGIIATVLEG